MVKRSKLYPDPEWSASGQRDTPEPLIRIDLRGTEPEWHAPNILFPRPRVVS